MIEQTIIAICGIAVDLAQSIARGELAQVGAGHRAMRPAVLALRVMEG